MIVSFKGTICCLDNKGESSMVLFNAHVEFVGSGNIIAGVDTVRFEDTFITTDLPVAEAGHAGLDARFVNTSILGALNELMDGLTTTSGQSSVTCYSEAVDTSLFVHNLNHALSTFNVNVTMYDANPISGPAANNVIACFTPIDADNVRVELDAAASGFFIVWGCGS
jgi:hypothetical protein